MRPPCWIHAEAHSVSRISPAIMTTCIIGENGGLVAPAGTGGEHIRAFQGCWLHATASQHLTACAQSAVYLMDAQLMVQNALGPYPKWTDRTAARSWIDPREPACPLTRRCRALSHRFRPSVDVMRPQGDRSVRSLPVCGRGERICTSNLTDRNRGIDLLDPRPHGWLSAVSVSTSAEASVRAAVDSSRPLDSILIDLPITP